MIPFEEALKLVLDHTPLLSPVRKRIYELGPDILAEDIRALKDMPPFTNSAMDGFALRAEDTAEAPVTLKVIRCLRAGDAGRFKVQPGEAVRIMTGARLPKGADAVVKKEDVEEGKETIVVRETVKTGENVRPRGEEMKKGEMALRRGVRLNPASIGLLSALGYESVNVYRKPRISLLVTGDELVPPGQKIRAGKIHDSNSPSLAASLAGLNMPAARLCFLPDNRCRLTTFFRKSLEDSDVLLISGGISVGDYDFVQEELLKLGVKRVFWKVAIKPGKPTFFGQKDSALIFGLPGNPVSALVVFLEFVRPSLLKMAGEKNLFLHEGEARLEEKLRKKADRLYFISGRLIQKDGAASVRSTGLQHSHMLSPLATANCLIILEKDREFYRAGEKVRVHYLPWG